MMSPGSLENVFIDVEPGTISGLDLLGQVSSQLSRLNEVSWTSDIHLYWNRHCQLQIYHNLCWNRHCQLQIYHHLCWNRHCQRFSNSAISQFLYINAYERHCQQHYLKHQTGVSLQRSTRKKDHFSTNRLIFDQSITESNYHCTTRKIPINLIITSFYLLLYALRLCFKPTRKVGSRAAPYFLQSSGWVLEFRCSFPCENKFPF